MPSERSIGGGDETDFCSPLRHGRHAGEESFRVAPLLVAKGSRTAANGPSNIDIPEACACGRADGWRAMRRHENLGQRDDRRRYSRSWSRFPARGYRGKSGSPRYVWRDQSGAEKVDRSPITRSGRNFDLIQVKTKRGAVDMYFDASRAFSAGPHQDQWRAIVPARLGSVASALGFQELRIQNQARNRSFATGWRDEMRCQESYRDLIGFHSLGIAAIDRARGTQGVDLAVVEPGQFSHHVAGILAEAPAAPANLARTAR